jgi:hypothetical protein
VAAANTVSVTVEYENGNWSTTDVAEQTGTDQESTFRQQRNGVGCECSSEKLTAEGHLFYNTPPVKFFSFFVSLSIAKYMKLDMWHVFFSTC